MNLILSVTSLSPNRRETGVFYCLIVLLFCLFLRIKFFKKAFDVAMSKTKLQLFLAHKHLSVLLYVWCK